MAFIHRGLLLLICLPGCSQLGTTAFQSGLARDGVTFPSALSRETIAAKSRDLQGLLSSCSPPRDNPQPCRAALPALPSPPGHRQSQGRTLLSRNPMCKIWYTTLLLDQHLPLQRGRNGCSFIFFFQGGGVRKFTFNYHPSGSVQTLPAYFRTTLLFSLSETCWDLSTGFVPVMLTFGFFYQLSKLLLKAFAFGLFRQLPKSKNYGAVPKPRCGHTCTQIPLKEKQSLHPREYQFCFSSLEVYQDEDFITFAISVPRDVNIPSSQGILIPLQGLYRQRQHKQSRKQVQQQRDHLINKDHTRMFDRTPTTPTKNIQSCLHTIILSYPKIDSQV